MNWYRLAGEVVSTIHIFWQITTWLALVLAVGTFGMGILFACNDEPHLTAMSWPFIRFALCSAAFWFAQGRVMHMANCIWHDCPALMLERSLFMRDSQHYGHRIKSPFCEWIARRFSVNLLPDAVVFTAMMSLTLAINAVLFAPVVYMLYFWL